MQRACNERIMTMSDSLSGKGHHVLRGRASDSKVLASGGWEALFVVRPIRMEKLRGDMKADDT